MCGPSSSTTPVSYTHLFGKPIAAQQSIAFKLADMATKLRCARFLIYSAAELKDVYKRQVYEKMVQLCSKEDSRPPLAPAFIVKYRLVSVLYSQPSNRQIGQRTPSPQS